MGILGRHLQEVEGNSLRRLGPDTRQATEFINEGTQRSGEQLARHFTGAGKRLQQPSLGGQGLIGVRGRLHLEPFDVDVLDPALVRMRQFHRRLGASGTAGVATSAAPVRPSSTISVSVTGTWK